MKGILVSIIDDDASIRSALSTLVRSNGAEAETYESADAFLASDGPERSQCIITDIQMPGTSGIDLPGILSRRACSTPVIIVTARREKAMLDLAYESGAFVTLKKPVISSALLNAVDEATSRESMTGFPDVDRG